MNSSHCKCDIRRRATELGAYRCGFAKAEAVDADARDIYEHWLAEGKHGTMEFCARYCQQRDNPVCNSFVSEETDAPGDLKESTPRTIIVCAFNYNAGQHPTGLIARYALGADYHWVVKQRLNQLAEFISKEYGAKSRVCVDTAPMRERYWARRAGVGIVGVNNQLIIPGAGSYFVLGELITTLEIEPDQPLTQDCGRCMACVRACPGGALDGNGGCDARRCLSYQTIEEVRSTRYEVRNADEEVRSTRYEVRSSSDKLENVRCVYGCDICQEVCPHNADAPLTNIPEFAPRPEIMGLTPEIISEMGSAAYRRLTAVSAMRRVPLKKLKSNLTLLTDN